MKVENVVMEMSKEADKFEAYNKLTSLTIEASGSRMEVSGRWSAYREFPIRVRLFCQRWDTEKPVRDAFLYDAWIVEVTYRGLTWEVAKFHPEDLAKAKDYFSRFITVYGLKVS